MKRALVLILMSLGTSFAAGCGTGGNGGGGDSETGDVELSLAPVPDDAACLRVTATGSRALTRLFSLTPATSPTFAVDRLPFELDDANGQAVDRERGAR